ncbi:5-carboxymethyl-2-hydroxymuconate Delta-isomerase [Legionella jordanis]|uniref:5-carboxymethyl-2-hydroxymuconate Delta-isomerase n=1 Tax=Legionella jordanis TaxID=456 RepID=A0A0W0VCG7_9GAMM|nr:5-carboxymethyl-2-hydroxymuconate Delta-isomerase [Legionella jordanis]KTD17581.1 5-carboxymethyl-2-hydroxymuconate Delta-isomerase [Legionella jordanis]RMX00864.1 5-carboxymethyl-2-hydroxymuconate Delta-isomerase [Legionella jordanis]RMX17925.1 5-carboxymethyl-2-hydroxymuconate Delta-isomerase [Legionella jordanis]VEH11497.1 5-carboxymethyl-2-hydroxymuconate Delta-isomerase [Legionella jordanis]HAT8714885.1 hypothetical protein [Legionella jordanis]
MPQLTLEYSSNVIEEFPLADFFRKCHDLLSEGLPTKLQNCKSRAICHQQYFIADGQADHAFAHLQIRLLPGRSPGLLQKIAEEVIELLKVHFARSIDQLNLQLSLEIQETGNYFKIST